MAMQFTDGIRNAAADAVEAQIGASPVLTIRTGAPPANAGLAATGTVLATINLAADWLTTASGGAKSLLGTAQDTSADATGRAGHFRITGGVQVWQGLCADAWQGSRVYAIGDQVMNGGSLYRATVAGTAAPSGGPTGTGASITDGGVTWTYVQTGADMTIDNASLVITQQFNVTALSLTVGGA